MLCWFIFSMLSVFDIIDGHKILVVFPAPALSHYRLGNGFVDILLEAGHEVTYVTPFPWEEETDNLSFIDLSSFANDFDSLVNISLLMEDENAVKRLSDVRIGFERADYTLQHPNMKTLLLDTSVQYDLIIVERFLTDIYSGLSSIFNAPVVFFIPLEYIARVQYLFHSYPNPAVCTADIMRGLTPPFNIFERFINLWDAIYDQVYYSLIVFQKEKEIYERNFRWIANKRKVILPSYEESLEQISFVFTASHFTLSDAKVMPHNVKDIGGYHIEDNLELPKDLKDIMDKSVDGVIFFSLGSNLKPINMKREMKSALMDMFGSLKQTIIWKFEENWPEKPENVITGKWFPQTAILKHRNVIAFITHGGLLSMTEAVHFAVPMIGIPVFADQFINMKRVVDGRYGIQVKLSANFTPDLNKAIHKILNNKWYKSNITRISDLYHNRPLSPKQELLYWVNYIVKYGNTKHLDSLSRREPLTSQLHIDLLLMCVAIYYLITKFFGLMKNNKTYCFIRNIIMIMKKYKTHCMIIAVIASLMYVNETYNELLSIFHFI